VHGLFLLDDDASVARAVEHERRETERRVVQLIERRLRERQAKRALK